MSAPPFNSKLAVKNKDTAKQADHSRLQTHRKRGLKEGQAVSAGLRSVPVRLISASVALMTAAVLGAVVRVLIEHGVLTDARGGSNSITSIKLGVSATVPRTYHVAVVRSLISNEKVWIEVLQKQKSEAKRRKLRSSRKRG